MVEQEVTRLAQAIREDVVNEMVKMAEALVKEKINQGDQQRLSKEYLDGMSPRSMPAGKPTE
jgi:F0F1-type ATP synthase membrane subunit b/b'